jgi:hypothetical protein
MEHQLNLFNKILIGETDPLVISEIILIIHKRLGF